MCWNSLIVLILVSTLDYRQFERFRASGEKKVVSEDRQVRIFHMDANPKHQNIAVCAQCRHVVKEHRSVTDGNNVRRIYCTSCPRRMIRMMGDENNGQPTPFLVEGPLGPPKPCYEEKPENRKRENFLPLSPASNSEISFELGIEGGSADERIRFTGISWYVEEVENLRPGDYVKNNLVYKYQLYADQEYKCRGCNRMLPFDNIEMDRVIPENGYTVGNVQLLCSSCNRIKGNRGMAYLLKRRNEQGFWDHNYRDDNA